MTEEYNFFISVGKQLESATQGELFGKPCFKTQGKAFVCFFQNEMVFKLNGEAHMNAMSLEGAKLFDPSGKGRPMKEWVQLSVLHKDQWREFAEAAKAYVELSIR